MKRYATTDIDIKLQMECTLGAEVLYMAVECLDMINWLQLLNLGITSKGLPSINHRMNGSEQCMGTQSSDPLALQNADKAYLGITNTPSTG